MAKLSIRSIAPAFRRCGIAFNRTAAVEVDTDTLKEDQVKLLNSELESGRNLVLAPTTPAEKSGRSGAAGDAGGTSLPAVKAEVTTPPASTGNAKRSKTKPAAKPAAAKAAAK